MGDIRRYNDKDLLYHYDLPTGKDVVVTISHFKQGEFGKWNKGNPDVPEEERKKQKDGKKKPVVFFVGKTKGFALNTTNQNTIGELFGTFEEDALAGKKIALYISSTKFGGKPCKCIRIRNKLPE